MNVNSSPVSKRMKIKTATELDKPNSTDDIGIATSASVVSEVTISEDVVDTFANVFIEDILLEIFDNLEILNAKDLLNFRLVNRCWRDAATSVLLKRNICEIALSFDKLVLEEDTPAHTERSKMWSKKTNFKNKLSSWNYINAHKPKCFLSDLSQLISSSPKFPSTSIRFHHQCALGFGNLCQPSDMDVENQNQKDLFNFFSLYGKKIKTLSLSSVISKKAVQNLLYVHMPHLTCLNLTDFGHFSVPDQTSTESKILVCLPPPSTLELEEIVIRHLSVHSDDLIKFIKELVRASPNLRAIKNVDASALPLLLQLGKAHLIQDLCFDPTPAQLPAIQKFAKLLTYMILADNLSSLKLRRLNVTFTNIRDHGSNYDVVAKFLNIILSAIKGSLNHLRITMGSTSRDVNLFIPPLPHLRYLMLLDYESSLKTRFSFLGDVFGEAVQAGTVTADLSAYDLNSLSVQNQQENHKIPADYFPCLSQVVLMIREMKYDSERLLGFFSLQHVGPDGVTTIPSSTLLAVTNLQLLKCPCHASTMSKLFPNISSLKINYSTWYDFQNLVWTAFSKLKKFEIFGFQNNWDENTQVVDGFFTGFSHAVCAQLEGDAISTESKSERAKAVKRTQPYIADCENLEELKIKFDEALILPFASKVTAVYGFKEVHHRTKIIFSFESLELSEEEIQETLEHLDPVAAFVEVRMK